jgi:hypothetical protein
MFGRRARAVASKCGRERINRDKSRLCVVEGAPSFAIIDNRPRTKGPRLYYYTSQLLGAAGPRFFSASKRR